MMNLIISLIFNIYFILYLLIILRICLGFVVLFLRNLWLFGIFFLVFNLMIGYCCRVSLSGGLFMGALLGYLVYFDLSSIWAIFMRVSMRGFISFCLAIIIILMVKIMYV